MSSLWLSFRRRGPLSGRSVALHGSRLFLVFFTVWLAYTQTQPAANGLSMKQLKEDLYVIEGTSNGSGDVGNVAVYLTSEGVILVDDRFDQDYADILAKVKTLTDLPVKYIVNTHHHGDHTGGNAKFFASQNLSEILIHANARKHMVDGKMPGIPRVTFTDEASLFLGGKEVRAIYPGKGHTDGDIAVYFPARKVVCLGDLMAGTNGVTNPVVDYTSGGSLGAWPATLDAVLKLDVDTVIPGHGAVTDKAGLTAHRTKVAAIRERIKTMVTGHNTKEEITQAMLSQFDFKPINMRGLDGMIAELGR
jgi:glyoxylase-like metal-dependent hydrolase (beta-lactamase superfamily II)